jgi:hypothetical protein
MDDHFHSSLKELRLQLDLMNSRTASILNKSRQHSNMLTNDIGEGVLSPSVTADNLQQIKHIGATVGTLARNQEDRFQALEHQLNALSNKLDDIILDNPQFTPPESSNSSDSASSRSDSASISSQHSTMPRSPRVEMAPATVADVGGYFCPNCPQHGHSGQQYISDVSSFVSRVNRTLRTRSIANIEVFLRGSALRWFHINLRADGTHVFDMFNGDFALDAFCDSLIRLFGVPESLVSTVNIETLPPTSSWKRSALIEDYIFPALEYLRLQENLFSSDSGVNIAVSKALALYNQSFGFCTVSPEVFGCKAYSEIQDGMDLLFTLGDLRRSELEQKLNRFLRKDHQIDAASTEVTTGDSEKGHLVYSKVQQNSVLASTNNPDCKISTLTPAGSHDNHLQHRPTTKAEVQPESSTLDMHGGVEIEVADSVANAIGLYPPAPTAESCPASPIASFQDSSNNLDLASQTNNTFEEKSIAVAMQTEKEIHTHQRSDSSRPDDEMSDVSKDDSIYSCFSEVPPPGDINIWLRPCRSAAQVNPNIRKTPSEWAQWLDAQCEKDPSSKQYPPLLFSYSVSDDKPMTYKRFGDVLLYTPGPETDCPVRESDASSKAIKTAFGQESAKTKATLNETSLFQAPDDKQMGLKEDDSAPEAGSLDIPEGADNCLTGLTFVFTGRFEHISREEVQNLVKRYGGIVAPAPNKKVDYVVLGAGAEPKKLAVIKKRNLRVIDKRDLFALISRLPARTYPVLETKKEAKRLKKAAEKIVTTSATPDQQHNSNPTATSGHQPLQQLSQQQQQLILPTPRYFPIGPQAKAFLNGFKVFPPTSVNPKTLERENHRDRIMATLTGLVAMQEDSVGRFQESHGKISQLEAAGQTADLDLVSARDAARKDLDDAKSKIDTIRIGNENNRCAWADKSAPPHVPKTPVAGPNNVCFRPHPRKTQLVTNEKTKNEDKDRYRFGDLVRELGYDDSGREWECYKRLWKTC